MTARIGFIIVYIAIGITDVLDGLIARMLGCESDFGAKLDSIADFVFYSIFVFVLLKLYFSMLEIAHLFALMAVVFIRLINMLLTKLKYKKVVFIHTIANKASGVIIYFMPIVFLFTRNDIIIWIVLTIVLIAAIEELLITVKYTKPDLNRTSIFSK
jgi:CDP-diacylglycerol--glycerol-3-phosphate 3-phosphatidyltransferase